MPTTSEEVANVFAAMPEHFVADKADGINALIQFDLGGDAGGVYWVQIENGQCKSGKGHAENPQMTVSASADDYLDVVNGNLDAMQAFMLGRIKVSGDMSLALKLQTLFKL